MVWMSRDFQKNLADRLGKQPSEITKWLGGTHSFTTDTLMEISSVIKIQLVNDDMVLHNKRLNYKEESIINVRVRNEKKRFSPISQYSFSLS